ncbi:MAG: acyl-CoA desaturase [Phycisphaerales bacterium]|nr:acyl-CoA desaturase [Phycisphaerales bacterium]
MQQPTSTAVAPLKRPSATIPTEVFLRYLLPVILVHLLGLLAVLPFFFSWTGVIVCVLGIHLFGQAITMGYHRLLAHRSFTAPRWFEWTLTGLALCCLQDTPARWVATHRKHHVHSDEDEDPHTPRVAFLWSHLGWLMLRNHDLTHVSNYSRFARDILEDPFYFWLERHPVAPLVIYFGQCALFFGIPCGIAALLGTPIAEAVLLGASVVVWGVFARTVLVWHITWSVNSLTHMFGYSSHDTGEHSRNNWFVALVAAGEGWHNNHHHDPSACTVQHRWWEFDLTYWEVRALQAIGVVQSITPLRSERIRRAGKSPPRSAVEPIVAAK